MFTKVAISNKTIHFFIFLNLFCFTVTPQGLLQKLKDKLAFGGKEASLKDKKIKDFTLVKDSSANFAPGTSFRIGVIAITEEGKEMKTQGLSDGKVRWENYLVKVSGGNYSGGEITILSDPRKIQGNKVKISVSTIFDSTNIKTIIVPISFKANYVASYNGQEGESGRPGDEGSTGQDGASNSNANGSNGTDGRDGKNGGNGGNGQSGENVEVYVKAMKDPGGVTLLKVYTKSKTSGKEKFFIINPNGGSISIFARGGRGGSGGSGGKGGRGGYGGNGHNSKAPGATGTAGNGGNGGFGADGGNGGIGGDGGMITIYLDPSAASFSSLIKYDNSGGDSGLKGWGGDGGSAGGAGSADIAGKSGNQGKPGKYGMDGKPGMPGPKVTIITQPVNIDWDKVATGN